MQLYIRVFIGLVRFVFGLGLVFDRGTLRPLASGLPNLGASLSCGLSLSELLDKCLNGT